MVSAYLFVPIPVSKLDELVYLVEFDECFINGKTFPSQRKVREFFLKNVYRSGKTHKLKIYQQGCHGTGSLKVPFSRQGKHGEFVKKYLKNVFTQGIYHQHRENLRVKKKNGWNYPVAVLCQLRSVRSVNFWLSFCKFLSGLLK